MQPVNADFTLQQLARELNLFCKARSMQRILLFAVAHCLLPACLPNVIVHPLVARVEDALVGQLLGYALVDLGRLVHRTQLS